ncbi:MAG: ThuA domain-containing protein [Verrucomicrobiae bacterium]|nr:ThuA domain-containing protein [Verrucomicrobiae bacterium]
MRYLSITLRIIALLLPGLLPLSAKEHPHVVIVVGTQHYSPERSMPLFAKELERFGFEVSLVQCKGDPEQKDYRVLPGIEVLAEADIAIFFCRFLTLDDYEFSYFHDYITSGKPVVGLRTATHSFLYPKGHKWENWNEDFGRRAMGNPYIVHQSGTTACEVLENNPQHPVLSHVKEKTFTSTGSLYLTRLEPGVVPLVVGTGMGKSRLLNKPSGPLITSEVERDIVAWVWENEWGGQVFGTSFGDPGDFAVESIVRILVNGVCWAAGQPLPAAEVRISTWQIERDH